MRKQLNCAAQDLLEAAIVQKRRLNITCQDGDEVMTYFKVLPVDIQTKDGTETLYIMTVDNQGGLLRLGIQTDCIEAFEAKDFLDPRICYQRRHSLGGDESCALDP